ncbi:MAG: cation-transporting P-type ATPase [Clostridia bacterium]|nr:cation-transporting P-type ATPase [Clostridia bacterium]
MLTQENLSENNTPEEKPAKSRLALGDMMSLVISAELLASALFGVCAVLMLFLGDRVAEAIAAAVCLLVAGICVFGAERQHRDLMSLDRAAFRRLMYSVYTGKYTENGLRMSLVLRFAPLALGIVCVIVCLIRAIWGGVGEYGTLLSVFAVLSASAAMGVELPAVIAVSGGIVALKQRDIEVGDPNKLGEAARAKYVLADKSVFFASKGTETGGVYIKGKAYGVSELTFGEIYPLLSAIYVCDDGALSAAFGFRQQITDGLLRALRTTFFDHNSRFALHVTEFHPYDPGVGYAAATYTDSEGRQRTVYAGKPDALFPHIGFEADELGLRPLGEADMRHLRLHLRRTYSAGREVLAVAEESGREGELTLVGLLHMNCIISEEARESVRELKGIGVEPVYVSEENENCAFYHARELGVARDMSQVLTGARIENFRHENLVRAARHARLCAEAAAPHRRALVRLLSADRVVMAASRSGSDELLRFADVRVSSSGGDMSTDFVGRNCSVEDVSLVARVARSVCAVARRGEYQMFCAPVCAMLVSLFTLVAYGSVPFGIGAMLVLTALLPLPQMLLTAKMEVAPTKGFMMSLMMGKSTAAEPPISSGYGLACWNILNCLGTAVFASYIFGSYYTMEAVGPGGACSAALVCIGFYMLVNNLICRVWGKSCISLKDEPGGVKFIVATALVFVAVLLPAVVNGISGVFSMEALPYKHIPLTLVPGAVSLMVYELGGAIIRHRKSHSDK